MKFQVTSACRISAASLLAGIFVAFSAVAAETSAALSKPDKSYPLAAGEKPAVIVENGVARAVVVVSDNAEPWAKALYDAAALEFTEYVERITGVRLPVVTSSKYEAGPAVFIGMSDAARKAGFETGILKREGFRVTTKGGNLAIIGDDDSATRYGKIGIYEQKPVDVTGTLFGVNDVLERFGGVRWYWPGELGTVVPKSPDFKVGPADYSDAPLLSRREMWPIGSEYTDAPDKKEHPRFAKRWRSGNGMGVSWNHSYVGWDEAFGKTHPEYFALLKDGTRDISYYHGHLCHTNPDVLKQEIKNFKDFYEKGEAAAWGGWCIAPRGDYVMVIPNDCFRGCECKECMKLVELRKAKIPEIEEHSELIHSYGAKVAEEVKKLWPGKKVIVGAYDSYTLPPKTVKYPDNVVVGLCIMDGMAFHRTPETRKFWLDVIAEYNRLTDNRVEVWNYVCWPQTSTKAPIHCPFTVVDWHRLAQNKIAGEFINGSTGRTYALDHITMYFWHRAMWNPNFDVQAALDEYYQLCYGPAAPVMKEYFDLMINQWEKVLWDVPAGRVGGLPLDQLYGKTYPKEIRDRLKGLEAKALAAATEGSEFRRRVEHVVAAHQAFYAEADAYATLGDGNKLVLPKGTPAAIDGKLDDPCWTKNEGAMMVEKSDGKKAAIDSQVRGCWDDNAIYFALRFSEKDMDKLVTEKGELGVWMNDCVEIFVSPGIPDHYSQIVIDAAGNVFDGWKPPTATYTDVKDFKIEKAVEKGDGYWTVEVKIPYSELGVAAPAPGTSWRGNLIRVRRAGLKPDEAHFYYFSPTLGQSHHNPRFFGTLVLEETATGK